MAIGAIAGGAAAVLLAAKAAPLAVVNPPAAVHTAQAAFAVGIGQGAKLGVKASQALRWHKRAQGLVKPDAPLVTRG
ncbi:hypothetical protein [Streptomyces albipurpureus]|uniref:Uncharacterized protein n=1 Tax=Streptomyces albipurpureus TaxID=2897419 RepID=A0ABT0ULX9_9ACTN|nr:hypothetical protein [Streptomyces sp. CWNU-1]MCM2388630.1 hypothetical protein [Streptomyces sp. CWNU-1]